jgi:hypothetical protein
VPLFFRHRGPITFSIIISGEVSIMSEDFAARTIAAAYNVRAHFPIGQGTPPNTDSRFPWNLYLHDLKLLEVEYLPTPVSNPIHPGGWNIERHLRFRPSSLGTPRHVWYQRSLLPSEGEKVACTDHWGASSTIWSSILCRVGKAGAIQCRYLGRLYKLTVSACRRQRLLRGPLPQHGRLEVRLPWRSSNDKRLNGFFLLVFPCRLWCLTCSDQINRDTRWQ